MSSRNVSFIIHPALGGLDTTKAPTLLAPDQLTIADNIEYFTSGARKKRLGTARYNSSAISGAPTVTALGDFWRFGTSLTPTQKFVAAAGTDIYKDDGDGVWDSLSASWGSNSANVYTTIAQGYAVLTNDLNEAPQKWDQTTLSALTSSTIKFAACSYHLRRLWAIGESTAVTGNANPSRATYTAAGDITDFSGGDTGTFVLDEDDGDRIMGVSQSFRGRLYFFKGPNIGSVHEIDGLTPSTFTRKKITQGVPCVSHGSIITTPNDIFWASRFGFHSLEATDKFGDTQEAFISAPIQSLFNSLNHSRLAQMRGFYHPTRNVVGWFCADGGQSQNNVCFTYNFLLDRWAVWKFTGFNGASVMVGRDPTNTVGRIYVGGYDGFVRKGDQATLSDDNGSAYTAKIKTPVYVRFGDDTTELHEKQYYSITTIISPKGNYNATLSVDIGRETTQTANVSMGGGAALDSFTLDTDVLGGATYDYVESPVIGRGRSIQMTWEQGGVNQDMEIFGYAIRAAVGEGMSLEGSE